MAAMIAMRCVHVLLVLTAAAAWTDAAQRQTTPPATASNELRAHVRAERFQDVTSLRGLPLGVRDELQALFGGGSAAIAEPGAPFQGATAASGLPLRRLVVAGCSYEHCLVYYERGGGASQWRALLFHWTPEATRIDWGGAAPGGLRTLDEVRNVLVSGSSNASGEPW